MFSEMRVLGFAMVRKLFFTSSVVLLLLVAVIGSFFHGFLWSLVIVGPILLLGLYDISQKRHTILRIYPVIGHFRYLFESIRPEIQQYFVESDTNGQPVNREFRSLIYQRAKGVRDTRPFGTIFDVYRPGCEWINQSLNPKVLDRDEYRVRVGGPDCKKPYQASHLNISAMSFGALSQHAILALNSGAKLGGFAHNTGEGGLSPYHQKPGGDLIWQIGTGYFGCRNHDGSFNAEKFTEKATTDQVKMIEIKLSQGAKPGHGGILPKAKLTEEIATIRDVPLGHDVVSPAAHTEFSTPVGLLNFVAHLRELSGGKPVGFKLCVGRKQEFLAICKAMIKTGVTPDFITVDGSEGGTGAAPIELTNSVGMPMRDGLNFVHNALIGIGVRDRIKLIASGKIISGFHMVRAMALGADMINAARPMMFAIGCIQSRHCNSNQCPTGVATQDPARYKHLNIESKSKRVAEYHKRTIHAMLELVASAGLNGPDEVRAHHIMHRVDGPLVKTYAEIYPQIGESCLLKGCDIPQQWLQDWDLAKAENW